jgi:DNA-binding MarR family transcriptional regulator
MPDDEALSLAPLYERPGFRIRRAHQIATALFEAEVEGLGITNTQFGLLFILSRRPGIDQIGLAKLIGLDRSTTAMVVRILEAGGHVERRGDPQDRRRKTLYLTASGKALMDLATPHTRSVQARLLAVFTPEEAQTFQALLGRFVEAFNDKIRTPILPEE